mgnify:FL=1
MNWNEGSLEQAELIAQKDTEINLMYQNESTLIKLKKGQAYVYKIYD